MAAEQAVRQQVERERGEILSRLECWLEWPMVALAFTWLVLLIMEFVGGQSRWLESASLTIWIIFCVDFVVRFAVAPAKVAYLKRNWLTVLSLIVPAFRAFRIVPLLRVARVARVARGMRLIRIVSSINRGMRALGTTMRRRGFGYVVLLTVIVIFAGAAGMHAFEKEVRDAGAMQTFGSALWWTAMLVTTMGTDYWPQTVEGRILCFLLAIYAFAVFGYVTASIATFFIGRDAEDKAGEIAGESSIQLLREEIAALRAELRERLDR